jgi:NADPH:quinone reductase-like Zn-dependent oxidoreductase
MKSYHLDAFTGPSGLVIREHEIPTPGPRQVLIRVRANAISYREGMILTGTYPLPVKQGIVPLCEGAGEVVAVGGEVSRVRPGERVAANVFPRWIDGPLRWELTDQLGSSVDGLLTEYAVLDEDALVHIPEHLSYIEAAALPLAALTAWNALMGARAPRPGETVLVLGSGSVSLFALQFAKLAGARVIATTSSQERAERLRELGADATIDYGTTPEWPDTVRALTDGRGADHVVEVAGDLRRSLRAVALEGQLSYVGFWLAGADARPVDCATLFFSGCRLRCVAIGSRSQFAAMNLAVEERRLRPVLDRVFAFEEAREACDYFLSGRRFGRVVVSHE